MALYKSIVIWPFSKEQDLLLFPAWRLADTDCNLIIESSLDDLKKVYEVIELWGFVYTKTIPRTGKVRNFYVCATRGNPPLVDISSKHRTAYRALSLLPGPRLAVNSTYYKPGWKVWREDFYSIEDVYRYPVRKDFVNVDPQVLFLSYIMRKAALGGKKWRWQIGDAIQLMIAMGVSNETTFQFSSECTGQSIRNVHLFYDIARKVPEEIRDYNRSWLSYREELGLWGRAKNEIRQRTYTKLADVGFTRRGSVEEDV